jgi:hypothetical protein
MAPGRPPAGGTSIPPSSPVEVFRGLMWEFWWYRACVRFFDGARFDPGISAEDEGDAVR